MMIQPRHKWVCNKRSRCLEDGEVVMNLSSADPDIDKFYSYGSGIGTYQKPGAGHNWATSECDTIWGPISCTAYTQQEADACIAQMQWLCDFRDEDGGTTDDSEPPIIPFPTNLEQTCSYSCNDGTQDFVESYTVEAGVFTAISQEIADSMAHEYACLMAQALVAKNHDCFPNMPSYWNTAQSCPYTCPNGQVSTGTVPANIFQALTQADADALAYQLACLLAMIAGATNTACYNQGDVDNTYKDGDEVNPPTNKQVFSNSAQSCTSFCPDGSPFTYTVPAGRFYDYSLLKANQKAYSYACRMAKQHRLCLSDMTINSCCRNTPVSSKITATGIYLYDTANKWEISSGSLPVGVTLNGGIEYGGSSVYISGTPLESGTFNFTVKLTLGNGDYTSRSYSMCVVGISPAAFDDGTVGTDYLGELFATTCVTGTVSWQVTSGSLPPGLTLDEATGIISGIPTTSGTYSFEITLQDSAS